MKKMDNELVAMCDLCKEPMNKDEITTLFKFVYHPQCFELAQERMQTLANIIFLPDDEFQVWLETL